MEKELLNPNAYASNMRKPFVVSSVMVIRVILKISKKGNEMVENIANRIGPDFNIAEAVKKAEKMKMDKEFADHFKIISSIEDQIQAESNMHSGLIKTPRYMTVNEVDYLIKNLLLEPHPASGMILAKYTVIPQRTF